MTTDLTRDEGECALCVWEYVLTLLTADNQPNPWQASCNASGTSQLRLSALSLGVEIERSYIRNYGPRRFIDAFDWEFIPRVVSMLYPGALADHVELAVRRVIAGHELDNQARNKS